MKLRNKYKVTGVLIDKLDRVSYIDTTTYAYTELQAISYLSKKLKGVLRQTNCTLIKEPSVTNQLSFL